MPALKGNDFVNEVGGADRIPFTTKITSSLSMMSGSTEQMQSISQLCRSQQGKGRTGPAGADAHEVKSTSSATLAVVALCVPRDN